LDAQVRPEKGHQFPFPKAADQFQIEHREETALVSGVQISFDMFRCQDFYFYFSDFVQNRFRESLALLFDYGVSVFGQLT